MQRKIKFRYWNGITNQMVTEPRMPYKEGWTIEQLFSDRGWVWQQFTGLTDRNGKEIYEGDVVQSKNTKAYVTWNPYIACWASTFITGRRYLADAELHKKEWKIIGNIYQHPELLKS